MSESLLLPLASVQFENRHRMSSNVTNTYKVVEMLKCNVILFFVTVGNNHEEN